MFQLPQELIKGARTVFVIIEQNCANNALAQIAQHGNGCCFLPLRLKTHGRGCLHPFREHNKSCVYYRNTLEIGKMMEFLVLTKLEMPGAMTAYFISTDQRQDVFQGCWQLLDLNLRFGTKVLSPSAKSESLLKTDIFPRGEGGRVGWVPSCESGD